MLKHLRVTNFALLSDVSIEFGPGFNVLTGETGAGKSLIVEAVNLLRGGRASADMPRAGSQEAVVEAILGVPDDLRDEAADVLARAGLPTDSEGELLIRRVIAREGRSRTFINGAMATAGTLGELGGLLIDLSGQHEHQGLVVAARHRQILDAYAGLSSRAEALRARYAEYLAAEDELARLTTQAGDRAARAEYLNFLCGEIETAAPQPGELEALEAERVRLAAVDQLQRGVYQALAYANQGEDSAADRLAGAVRELEKVARFDGELAQWIGGLREAKVLLDDAAGALAHYEARLEANPERLAELMARSELLRKLCRKHGGGLEEVIVAGHAMRGELEALSGHDDRVAALTAQRDERRGAALTIATELSKARATAAAKLGKEVHKALAELGMGAAKLRIAQREEPLGPTGTDHIEFLLAANVGMEAKPLAKVASGGELSRIMLAIKMCLRRADRVGTYVFDEVDTGVGGSTALAIGRQIRQVAATRQVVCITHLAQLAAFADHHFAVAKHHTAGLTETTVKSLSPGARRDELARMLGGSATAKAKAHAQELLAEARAA